MGTPEFAVPALERILTIDGKVVGVVTQPDRPKGRRQKIAPPPIKEIAVREKIDLIQPERIRDPEAVSWVRARKPDLIVVVAFGQILPKDVLDIPRWGCVNLHASLLPKYRGAAPIARALMEGETRTGVTTMKMNERMDAGDIYLQREIPLGSGDTLGSLHDRLAALGAELLEETIAGLDRGTLIPIPQDDSKATYAPKLDPNAGNISWDADAETIDRFIRGLSPVPGAFTHWKGERLKIYFSRTCPPSRTDSPGTVLSLGEEGIEVAAGRGAVLLTDLQMQNRKRMGAARFVRGSSIRVGDVFGGI
jgi:methionyl-tRNA formyltransferase